MHSVHTRDRVPFRYEQKDLACGGFVSAWAFCLHGCFSVMLPLSPLFAHPVLPRLRPRIMNVSSTTFPIGVTLKATVAFLTKCSTEAGLIDMPLQKVPSLLLSRIHLISVRAIKTSQYH
jgi:hypothetical protein